MEEKEEVNIEYEVFINGHKIGCFEAGMILLMYVSTLCFIGYAIIKTIIDLLGGI